MLMSKGKLDMLKGLVLASVGDDPPLSPAAALELIAQAAQAVELAEENARLAASEAAMRMHAQALLELCMHGGPEQTPPGHICGPDGNCDCLCARAADDAMIIEGARDALSSSSPLADAHKAAMRLAEHVTRPAWHTLIQVDGRAMALKEEYLSAQAACAPTGAEGTPNEH